MKLLFLSGPQGCGKGTQAQKIISYTGYNYFEMGSLLRGWAMVNPTDPIATGLKKGRLAPDHFVNEMFKTNVIIPRTPTVVDGFPRTKEQVDYILQFKNLFTPLFIKIIAPENVLIERMLARGRNDDNPEAIKRRLTTYISTTVDAMSYFARQTNTIIFCINGNQNEESVWEDIKKIL